MVSLPRSKFWTTPVQAERFGMFPATLVLG
ncbi:Uncharacterised protein [Mycobacterium tuberculosis]|nr:Uncharacterised protein [Mycobacterium tuberculosis]